MGGFAEVDRGEREGAADLKTDCHRQPLFVSALGTAQDEAAGANARAALTKTTHPGWQDVSSTRRRRVSHTMAGAIFNNRTTSAPARGAPSASLTMPRRPKALAATASRRTPASRGRDALWLL